MRRQQSNTVIVTQPRKQSGRGGFRPGSGRPKGGSRTSKTPQIAQSIKLIGIKREKALWKLALQIAEETRNVDQLIRALDKVNEIQRGRPYVATNPNMAPVSSSDDRLVMAIQNLQIVSQSPGQTGKAQAVETKETPVLPSECLTISSERDIEAKENARKSGADHAQIDR